MNFTSEELAALAADTVSLGIFFRLETSPVVRLWLGFGDIEPGVDATDPDGGGTYSGFGELKDVPTYRQLLNGAAERVEISLSGVSGKVFDLAQSSPDSIKGAAVRVGFALMRADWSMMAGVHWLANYRADFLALTQSRSKNAPVVRTLTLSMGSRFTARRRPRLSYFTDADQQARFPGDTFCLVTSKYATNFAIIWPRF